MTDPDETANAVGEITEPVADKTRDCTVCGGMGLVQDPMYGPTPCDQCNATGREHLAGEAAKRPITYNEASSGNIVDQMDRYRELADRDLMARSIATLKARGTYEPNEHVNEEKFPPLTAAEHLELLALGERIARYYRHPSQVDKAVKAGASWAQIAAATGTTEEAARAGYRQWAGGQHRLRSDFPGGTIGLDDDEYAAAIEAADTGTPGAAS